MRDTTTPIDEAVRMLGGLTAASKVFGVSGYQTIQQWKKTRVPAEYCPAIERATQGQVTCEELRPDVDWGYLRATRCEEKAK